MARTRAQRTSLTSVSLFSGCGGSDLGLRDAGVHSILANDISESACLLFDRIVGRNIIVQKPVSEIARFPKCDILVGCYPCQGYSQAGRRVATDGLNYLYREFDRALRQVRPLAFIVENVSGISRGKNAELLRNQVTRFRMAGYAVRVGLLNAKDYGLAQDRKRIFIVGIRSSERKAFRFPGPTHGATDGVRALTMRDVIWHLRNAPPGSYNEEPFHWYYLSRNRRHEWDSQSPCIVAHWRHTGLHPDSPPLKKVGTDHWEFSKNGFARRFSFLECAALQGFPDPKAFDVCTVQQRFTAIGNAVPPPLFSAVARELVRTLEQ